MGRRLDDITTGEQVTGRSITIGEWHVMTFAGLTGDFYPLHTDEEFARKTDFEGRIAHGLLTFVVGAGFLANELSSWGVIAALGFGATRFVAPVKFGDALTVTLTCKQLTPRDSADYGEVRWDAEVTRQDGESVARYDVLTLVAKQGAGK